MEVDPPRKPVLYVNPSADNLSFVCMLAADSGHSLRAVVDMILDHCRADAAFQIPKKVLAVDVLQEVQKRRQAKLRRQARIKR